MFLLLYIYTPISDKDIASYIDPPHAHQAHASSIPVSTPPIACIAQSSQLASLVRYIHNIYCEGAISIIHQPQASTAVQLHIFCDKCILNTNWASQTKACGQFIWDDMRLVSSFTVGVSLELIQQLLDSWYIPHPPLGGSHEKHFVNDQLIPVIKTVHAQRMKPILESIKNHPRTVAADGTYQNRNNNSEWGSAIVQDLETHYIINIHNLYIEDTPHKQAQGIEVPATVIALTELVDNGIKIAKLTTDGKTDLEATLKQNDKLKDIQLQHDAWHKGKNISDAFEKHVFKETKCDKRDTRDVKDKKMALRHELTSLTENLIWHWRESCKNCKGNVLLLVALFWVYFRHKICMFFSCAR